MIDVFTTAELKAMSNYTLRNVAKIYRTIVTNCKILATLDTTELQKARTASELAAARKELRRVEAMLARR